MEEGDALGWQAAGGGIVQYRSELDKKLMKEGTKLVQHKGEEYRSMKGCSRDVNLTQFHPPGVDRTIKKKKFYQILDDQENILDPVILLCVYFLSC